MSATIFGWNLRRREPALDVAAWNAGVGGDFGGVRAHVVARQVACRPCGLAFAFAGASAAWTGAHHTSAPTRSEAKARSRKMARMVSSRRRTHRDPIACTSSIPSPDPSSSRSTPRPRTTWRSRASIARRGSASQERSRRGFPMRRSRRWASCFPIASASPRASTRTPRTSTDSPRSASDSSRSARSRRARNRAIRGRACSACRKAHALINRLGFNNDGVAALLRQSSRAHAIAACSASTSASNFDTPNERAADDYVACLRAVYAKAHYVTVNISSPNTKGLRDLQAEDALGALLAR